MDGVVVVVETGGRALVVEMGGRLLQRAGCGKWVGGRLSACQMSGWLGMSGWRDYSLGLRLTRAVAVVDGGRSLAFVSAGDVAGVSCRLVVSEGEGVGGFVYSPGLRLTRAVVVVDGGRSLAFISAGDVAGVSCRLVVSEGEGVGGFVYSPGLRLTRHLYMVP
jgi:hypothetical protein